MNTFQEARELAKQDPLKTLESLQKLKDDAAQKLEKQALRVKPVQTSPHHIKQKSIEDTYLRFKILSEALKDSPDSNPFMKDLKRLAQELSQDKNFMKTLKQYETQEAKLIERMTQEKAYSIAVGRDTGGMSL